MLRKFYKYEIKSAGKIMAVIYGVLIAATVLEVVLHVLLQKNHLEKTENFFNSISIVVYFFTVAIMILTTFIYLCVRFYQTMYSEQGYLTHTLPLTASQILNAKILSSFAYLLLTVVLVLLSVSIVISVLSGEGADSILCIIKDTVAAMAYQLKMTETAVTIFLIVMGCAAILHPLLICCAGFSIGQLFTRSKGIRGIAAIVILYYAGQIITFVVLVAGFFLFYHFTGSYEVQWFAYVVPAVLMFWITLYYVISRIIVQKHLNLA